MTTRTSQKHHTQQMLVKQAKLGDHKAFTLLIEPLQQKIYWRALKAIGSEEDAADILQDTLLKAYSKLQNFREESLFSSWVYQICTNHILMYHRTKKIRREDSLEDLTLSGVDINPHEQHSLCSSRVEDPEKIAMKREAFSCIEESTHHLEDHYLTIFQMWFNEGLDLAQIHKRSGLSVGAVKSRLHRARYQIKEHLKRQYSSDILDPLYHTL